MSDKKKKTDGLFDSRIVDSDVSEDVYKRQVLNSRPGPWLYSMPKAAQAGSIAQAAMTAIRVSQAGIMSEMCIRDRENMTKLQLVLPEGAVLPGELDILLSLIHI